MGRDEISRIAFRNYGVGPGSPWSTPTASPRRSRRPHGALGFPDPKLAGEEGPPPGMCLPAAAGGSVPRARAI
jgi:hypothetical protein